MTRVLRSPERWVQVAGGAAADLASILFPSDCHLCGAPFTELASVRVCHACLSRIGPAHQSQPENLCSRCGDTIAPESLRFAASYGVTECSACRLAPPVFERAVSAAPYDSELRELLHLLKFEGQRPIAEHLLGAWLAAAMLKLRPAAASVVTVIPVPLFAGRERTRGFNQARLLAQAALLQLRREVPEWNLTLKPGSLVRVKDTMAMFSLAPNQRRATLRGAFRVADAEAIANREVLLIDDIMTTSATARECARVLLRAGATKVWVATVARASLESPATNHNVARWSPSQAHPTQLVAPDPKKQARFGST